MSCWLFHPTLSRSQSLTPRVDPGCFMSSTIFEMLVFKEPRSLHSFFFTLCVLCIGPESTCQNCMWSVFDKCLCNSTEEHHTFLSATPMPRFHTPPHPTLLMFWKDECTRRGTGSQPLQTHLSPGCRNEDEAQRGRCRGQQGWRGGAGRGLEGEEPGRLPTDAAGATWRSAGEGS